MTEDQSRSEFEAWLGREAYTVRSDSGKYESHHIDAMWSAWQASRRTYRASDVSKNASNLDTLAERVHEARISALEEAAKACEDMHDEDRPSDYAYAMRALAVKTQGEQS